MIDQLAGAAIPASALETLVLPGRVPGYTPALLDELTAAGEVVWAGAGALPGSDGWLILAPAVTAPLLLPEPAEITMTPVHEAVLHVLAAAARCSSAASPTGSPRPADQAARHSRRTTATSPAPSGTWCGQAG